MGLHKMLSEMILEEFLLYAVPKTLYRAVCCCGSVTSQRGLFFYMPKWEHSIIYTTNAADQNSLILITQYSATQCYTAGAEKQHAVGVLEPRWTLCV